MQHLEYTDEQWEEIVSQQLAGDQYHTRNWPKNPTYDIDNYLLNIAHCAKKAAEYSVIAKKYHDDNPTDDFAKQNATIAEEVAGAAGGIAIAANELAKEAKEANISARNLIKYPDSSISSILNTNTEVAGICIDPEAMAKYDAIVNSAVETTCRYYCMAYHFERIAANCAAPALPPKPTSFWLVNFVNAAAAPAASATPATSSGPI